MRWDLRLIVRRECTAKLAGKSACVNHWKGREREGSDQISCGCVYEVEGRWIGLNLEKIDGHKNGYTNKVQIKVARIQSKQWGI